MVARIYWAGDSTVKDNDFTTFPQSGIGQGMRLFVKKEIEIKNYAENGRSTTSFINESRLARIYNEISAGDFLFIQFGHNDQKKEDPSRFADAWGDYQVNLEKFVNVARNKNANPVFITPLTRRIFLDEIHLEKHTHGDYPLSMLETGKRLDVPVIKLFSMSKKFIEKKGDKESRKYFMHLKPDVYPNYIEGLSNDNTHLQYEGAVVFAYMIGIGLRNLGGIYKELLLKPEELEDVYIAGEL